jgi:hypothetical protein
MQRAKSKHPRQSAGAAPSSEGMPDMPFEEGAHDALDPDLRHRMISEAAYNVYAQRGYQDGYDVDDWLQAEAQIEHIILNPDRGKATDEASAPLSPQ